MNSAAAFAAGLVFGIGLLVSGMANPAKVLGFLDFAGRWDPSLLVVMATAVPVAALAYLRKTTLAGVAITLPAKRDIDRRLVFGAVLFGIGWGLAGFCPAPAIVSVGAGRSQGIAFVVALIAGMAIFEIVDRASVAPRAVEGDA